MLFPTFPREALLVSSSCPLWNPPSTTVESTLSSRCYRFGPPSLSLLFAKMLSLTLSHLTIWTDCSLPFLFGKGSFANCSLSGAKSFSAVCSQRYVCSSYSAKAWTILQALGSTNKSAISFLLSFYLKLSGRNCVFPLLLLSSYNGSPDTHFFRTMTRLKSWLGGMLYTCLLQSNSSCIHFFLFSEWKKPAHLNFSTHRLPRSNLCFLVALAVLLSSPLQ